VYFSPFPLSRDPATSSWFPFFFPPLLTQGRRAVFSPFFGFSREIFPFLLFEIALFSAGTGDVIMGPHSSPLPSFFHLPASRKDDLIPSFFSRRRDRPEGGLLVAGLPFFFPVYVAGCSSRYGGQSPSSPLFFSPPLRMVTWEVQPVIPGTISFARYSLP